MDDRSRREPLLAFRKNGRARRAQDNKTGGRIVWSLRIFHFGALAQHDGTSHTHIHLNFVISSHTINHPPHWLAVLFGSLYTRTGTGKPLETPSPQKRGLGVGD